MRRLILAAFLAAALPLASDQFPAQVVEIMPDSQQINVKGRGPMPLWGVNLPREKWMWGKIVRAVLIQLLVDRGKVICTTIPRSINGAARFTQHKKDIGLIMLRMGLAWHDPEAAPKDDPLHSVYAEAEKNARRFSHGIWGEPNLVTSTGAPMVQRSETGATGRLVSASQKRQAKKKGKKKK